ncbi:Uncharacterized protein GBIM_00516 [Gryllus bimaculatus]|nr:Uncharacterized protein GBIM_00516 [Gryllus bimaculatus]
MLMDNRKRNVEEIQRHTSLLQTWLTCVVALLQGVLVQEVDEGQPCLTCHEKCPGFTPHMWRSRGGYTTASDRIDC